MALFKEDFNLDNKEDFVHKLVENFYEIDKLITKISQITLVSDSGKKRYRMKIDDSGVPCFEEL